MHCQNAIALILSFAFLVIGTLSCAQTPDQSTPINDTEEPHFRFALDYSISDIMDDADKVQSFVNEYLKGETEFFLNVRNPVSMLTYDGYYLDEDTGVPNSVRYWSAPSKESLDIAICVKCIAKDPLAQLLISDGDPEAAENMALEILQGKLSSYVSFYDSYPGYCGFLPWFKAGEQLKPTEDWEGEIPGLDNGEWIWALMTAEYILRQHGHVSLADGYADYIGTLRQNVVKIFFDDNAGKIRGDVRVVNPESPGSQYETISKAGRMTYLTGEHAVHEGIMMVLFLTLFGEGLSSDTIDIIWDDITMKRVEHEYGTTWQAFWGSAHESWAWLLLPFRDLPEYRQLFRIREIIRSNDASERGYPGFPSSTNKPGGEGYISDAGIAGIGSQDCHNNDLFAIYGAFPMLLEFSGADSTDTGNVGLAWLLNMLQAPKMQGPAGGGESSMHDASAISTVKTIDGTFPNILALTGGLDSETAAMLHHHGIYDEYISIMQQEYNEAFGDEPLNEPVGFAIPDSPVISNIPDYTYDGESFEWPKFSSSYQQQIRPLLEAYGWTNDRGMIEDGDISWFYEHYDNLEDIERYLMALTEKSLYIYVTPDEEGQQPESPADPEREPLSLMNNWKLGTEGRSGWGDDGASRLPDGTLYIPGSGWTGEMVEPFVIIDGRNYIGITGTGEFLLEVKNQYDVAFITKVNVHLSQGETKYIEIPVQNRNDEITVIAITDYTQDVYIEDIFIVYRE